MKSIYLFILFISGISLLFSCNESLNSAPEMDAGTVGLSSGFKSESGGRYELEVTEADYSTYQFAGADADVLYDIDADVQTYNATDASGNNGQYRNREVDRSKPPITRKLVKTADLKFEVDSLGFTASQLKIAAKKYGGYVSSENEVNSTYQMINHLTIRVPSDKFDALISICDTEGKGTFDKREISAHDVTEEFIDLSARVKTKKELENRYHELLKKAKDVEEVIKVEREIGKLRSEIEASEGRLKYLSDRVSMSTIHIEAYQTIERVPTIDTRPNRFVRAFKSGWKGLVSFFVGLVHIWPFLLIMSGVGWFLYRRVRKYRASRKQVK